MSAVSIAALGPAPDDDDTDAFGLVLQYAMDNVAALTGLADTIATEHPGAARHVRQMAADVSRRTLDCLRGWPA